MDDKGKAFLSALGIIALSLSIAACGGASTTDSSGGPGPGGGDGSATLTWQEPVTNEDDSCISRLSGYRVLYGLAPEALDRTVLVRTSNLQCEVVGQSAECGEIERCSYTVDGLESASWYFALVAVDEYGNGSDPSNVAVKTIQ